MRSSEHHAKENIVARAPLLSVIKFYFALIQKSTLKKPKQEFKFVAGEMTVQDDYTTCSYFAAAATDEVIESPEITTGVVLADRDNIADATRKDMVRIFKMCKKE